MTQDDLLADVEVIATEPGLTDAQRGRLLREAYDRTEQGGSSPPAHDGLERAPDGSIIRHGVSGWTR